MGWAWHVTICYLIRTISNVSPFHTEISHKHMVFTRWLSGIVVLLLSTSVLKSYGFTMYLLPWISLGIIVHAAYGYLISNKKTKVFSLIAG